MINCDYKIVASQNKMSCLLSRVSATIRVSLLTGAYVDFVGWVNLLATHLSDFPSVLTAKNPVNGHNVCEKFKS